MRSEESMRSLCISGACASSSRGSPSSIGAATLLSVSGPIPLCSSSIKACVAIKLLGRYAKLLGPNKLFAMSFFDQYNESNVLLGSIL